MNPLCVFGNVEWNIIKRSVKILDIQTNFTCGQAFRWRCLPDSTLVGVFAHRVWCIKQTEDNVCYKVLACPHWQFISSATNFNGLAVKRRKTAKFEKDIVPRTCSCKDVETEVLIDYLQLDKNMENLHDAWKKSDKKFSSIPDRCMKIRVLRQDPTETLFSFLCSVNNSISRIVPMIHRLCTAYGNKLLEVGHLAFYDFPSVDKLSKSATEDELRQLGFGYRARYINSCAREVMENGGSDWLNELRNSSYDKARTKLVKLHGVGMKVADCVCLMALDKSEAVPVDTHIRQIAARDYGYKAKSKSLTNVVYQDIGSFFRSLWGNHAGWAQAVLFVADIKSSPKLYALTHDFEDNECKPR